MLSVDQSNGCKMNVRISTLSKDRLIAKTKVILWLVLFEFGTLI